MAWVELEDLSQNNHEKANLNGAQCAGTTVLSKKMIYPFFLNGVVICNNILQNLAIKKAPN